MRVNRIGKLIIAVDETELEALDGVAEQARANGVPGIERIDDPSRLRELEPSVRCVAALWSETSGVVDQSALMASFASAAQERGAWLALKHEVAGIARIDAGFRIELNGPDE